MVQWQDFDLEGRVKIPLAFYLVLVYLARGYLTWVISLTYRDDTSLLLSMIYPDPRSFGYSLLLGLPALICFLLMSLKSYRTKKGYKVLWKRQRIVLLAALVLDTSIQGWFSVHHLLTIHWFQPLMTLVGGYLTWYWYKSKRIERFFNNWLV
jgi:glucose-6-phosphate-specific signal transduction histidine kinase